MSDCFQSLADGLDSLASDLSLQGKLASAFRDSEFAQQSADVVCRIEESLRACDKDLSFVESEIQQEAAAVTQALVDSAQASPSKHSAAQPASTAASDVSQDRTHAPHLENRHGLNNVASGPAINKTEQTEQALSGLAKTPAVKRAPRSYVSKSELATCSSYMVGRLTVEKVNAAIEECAEVAEGNHRMMAMYRKKPGTLGPAERARALDVSRLTSTHPGLKGFWFLETDLKSGVAIKMDNTGKSLLQLLRHLKRLSEVRGKVGKTSVSLYIMSATD